VELTMRSVVASSNQRRVLAVLAAALSVIGTACDKVPLLAPTNSTIALSAPTRVLPTNGSVTLTAIVSEQNGSPVQNGTTVRFTSTLGRLDPAEAQTRNGVATTTFFAGAQSGLADIHAVSGNAGLTASSGGAAASSSQSTLQISIGAAAVKGVTVRANPSTVGVSGGQVELTANVVGDNGTPLDQVLVTFSADQGTLGAQTATTDSNGQARTTLTTAVRTTVTAAAGTITSAGVVVDLRAGPAVTIACAPVSGGANCASVAASGANSATVVFTLGRAAGSSALRDATLDFGDGSTLGVGSLAGGSTTVSHTYSGPSGSTPATYTAVLRVTDVNGESGSATTAVGITPRAPLGVTVAASLGSASNSKVPVTVTATVTPATGGADMAKSYSWDFGDGTTATTSGNQTTHIYTQGIGAVTISVTVTTTDGRSVTGQTQANP
jgi:hypothetical protein